MIVAALLLSACSSVNAGSASKQDLERAFAENPAIESMDLRVANDLPWVGGVSGDIIAKEGLDEVDRVIRLGDPQDGPGTPWAGPR